VDICRCQIVLVARAAWADDALSSEAPNAQCQRDQHSYQLEKMHLMRWVSNGHQDACSMIQYRKVQTSAYISATTPLCQPFCSLGKIAGANAPTIVASAAGSIGFAQQTNKRPGVLVAMQTRTNSNPATTLWKFSACGGFRFRVGQADERHLPTFVSRDERCTAYPTCNNCSGWSNFQRPSQISRRRGTAIGKLR
jgi:hypothetical protein